MAIDPAPPPPPWGNFGDYDFLILLYRLGPRVIKIKNGYPESSKVCFSIHLKKYIHGAYETTVWQTSRNCITPTELIKYGSPCAAYVCMRLIQTLLSQQRVIKLKSNCLSGMTMCLF